MRIQRAREGLVSEMVLINGRAVQEARRLGRAIPCRGRSMSSGGLMLESSETFPKMLNRPVWLEARVKGGKPKS